MRESARIVNRAARIGAALVLGTAAAAAAEPVAYTSQAAYLADLSSMGLTAVHEGFEDDAAWGDVRSSVVDGFHTAPAVSSLGLSWSSNHATGGVTTGEGPARTGAWGFYAYPHGDPLNGVGDGWVVTGDRPMVAFGQWIDTNTPYASLVFVIDGVTLIDFESVVLGTQPQFFGVIDADGFDSVEVRETEWAIDDYKLIFGDDARFVLEPAGCSDGDGDGYGSPASPSCAQPELDCDDADPAVNPGAVEIPGNGIDDDCDPTTPAGCQGER